MFICLSVCLYNIIIIIQFLIQNFTKAMRNNMKKTSLFYKINTQLHFHRHNKAHSKNGQSRMQK